MGGKAGKGREEGERKAVNEGGKKGKRNEEREEGNVVLWGKKNPPETGFNLC